jgi:cytoskeleton protein RodZ
MSDFGAKLRQARQQRGVTLRDIAEHTKFSVAALEALERNDASRLPGGIFARAFVRSYAAEVGLEPESTVREFVELFNMDPAPSIQVSALEEPRQADGRESAPRLVQNVLKLVVISLLAVALILYFTRIRHAEESSGLVPSDGRRTSRRSVSSVPKGARLP